MTKKLFVIVFLFLLIFQSNLQDLNALNMDNMNVMKDMKDIPITEELRLNVPNKYKKTWLQAEKEIWEPWLREQDGFLGRKIFYNENKEEALLLVSWKNKKLWKNISLNEVKKIQDKFEDKVKLALDLKTNPFEFVYEGELFEQK